MRLQLTTHRALVAVLTGALLLLAWPYLARGGIGEQRVSYTFHHFTDVDGVTVFTHYASSGTTLENGLGLSVLLTHDIVVFPAIEAIPGSDDAADAITSASRPIASNTGSAVPSLRWCETFTMPASRPYSMPLWT